MKSFYATYLALCQQKNSKPTAALDAMGLSRGNLFRWKNGSKPGLKNTAIVAAYFGVPVEVLWPGKVHTQKKTKQEDGMRRVVMKISRRQWEAMQEGGVSEAKTCMEQALDAFLKQGQKPAKTHDEGQQEKAAHRQKVQRPPRETGACFDPTCGAQPDREGYYPCSWGGWDCKTCPYYKGSRGGRVP